MEIDHQGKKGRFVSRGEVKKKEGKERLAEFAGRSMPSSPKSGHRENEGGAKEKRRGGSSLTSRRSPACIE